MAKIFVVVELGLVSLLPGPAPGEAASRPAAARSTATESAAVRRFGTLPPGADLPTDEACAAEVRPAVEVRPANTPQNQTTGRARTVPVDRWIGFPTYRRTFERVTGGFIGTTDEILQWASCKWGIDEDVTRARAVVESDWHQDLVGDDGHSVGILQVKCLQPGDPHDLAFPDCRNSTAYNADYATFAVRACYDNLYAEGGWFDATSVPAEPDDPARDERLWQCVGVWYSGEWQSANESYIEAVRRAYEGRSWERLVP